MREILFRGKRIDNGDLVEGTLYRLADEFDPFIMRVNRHGESYQVSPETVGQYTGLADKNGKKIFEGDIVQGYFRSNHSKQTFCVMFGDGMFLFDNNCAKVPKYDIYEMTVIGDIHDNPELLGGASP